MLSSVSLERVDQSIKPQVSLGEGNMQRAQNSGSRLIPKYTLTILAPNNLYEPAILTCKTREDFLNWLRIKRGCRCFHRVSTN